jgi:hypothetical protein
MSQSQNLITPPPELVQQWRKQAPRCRDGGIAREDWLMTRAAQWGADHELEACCEWVDSFQNKFVHAHDLRLVRRPQSPSLKSQALEILDAAEFRLTAAEYNIILRALEQLPN